MKSIDVRFDSNMINLLNSMVGKAFEKYKCDLFLYSGRSYRLVGLFVDGLVYKIVNEIEVQDYFGTPEDVAIFKLQPAMDSEIQSPFIDGKMIEIPVQSAIVQIRVVDEHQELYHNGEQTYDVWLTRGIIFDLQDGREISFEKSVWFSETIETNRGYNLLELYSPIEEFTEDWDENEGYVGKCTREIRTICEKGIIIDTNQ